MSQDNLKISELPEAPTGTLDNEVIFPVVVNVNGNLVTSKAEISQLPIQQGTGQIPSATSTQLGAIQLSGDLEGTALQPRVTGLNNKANLNSPVFTGAPAVPTPAPEDNSLVIPNTGWVRGVVSPINTNISTLQGQFSTLNQSINSLRTETISGHIGAAENKNYCLELAAAYAFTIETLSIQSLSGNCTAALSINSATVSDYSAISVGNSLNTVSPTTKPSVQIGQRLFLQITGNNSAQDVLFTLTLRRS